MTTSSLLLCHFLTNKDRTTSMVSFWRSFAELSNGHGFCYVFLIGWIWIFKKHFVPFFFVLWLIVFIFVCFFQMVFIFKLFLFSNGFCFLFFFLRFSFVSNFFCSQTVFVFKLFLFSNCFCFRIIFFFMSKQKENKK